MGPVRQQALLALKALAIANAGEEVEERWSELEGASTLVTLGAREVLVPAHAEFSHAYFVLSGAAKIVRTGVHRSTIAFVAEGEVVTLGAAFPSPVMQRALDLRIIPGLDGDRGPLFSLPLEVVTLEPLTALMVDLGVVSGLAAQDPAWAHLVELTLRAQLLFFTRVALSLREGPPAYRYQVLMDTRPDLVRRLSQREIAQYLDVSPVTLSRLTARLRDQRSTRADANRERPEPERDRGAG